MGKVNTAVVKKEPVVQKRYSIPFKLVILDEIERGKSYREIRRDWNISLPTINSIKNDQSLLEIRDPRLAEQRKKTMADRLQNVASRAVENITDDKLQNTGVRDLMIVAATAIDKARLIIGLSTENVSVRGHVESLKEEVGKLARLKMQMKEQLTQGRV